MPRKPKQDGEGVGISKKPLAVDLCSGLGGWAEGLEAEGWHVRRYDLYDMFEQTGTPKPEGIDLVLKDVLAMTGEDVADADLIVASPPCQFFSYTAMPWSLAKERAARTRADPELLAKELAIFKACFRIQREACEAAGRWIPMVVENVRGAIQWVGQSAYAFGSFHIWGDVPMLMPRPKRLEAVKVGGMGWYPPDDPRHQVGAAFNPAARGAAFHEAREGRKNPGFRFDGSGKSFQTESVERHVEGVKVPSERGRRTDTGNGARFTSRDCGAEGRKAPTGTQCFNDGPRAPDSLASSGSKSPARKAASAKIAKIPETLARHIGKAYLPTPSDPHPNGDMAAWFASGESVKYVIAREIEQSLFD